MKHVTITADGSWDYKTRRGGWAAVLRFGTAFREISGAEADTTNNRMELRAMLEAVRALKEPCVVTLRSDSDCAICWARPSGFKKVKPRLRYPEAYAMAQEFHELAKRHHITFVWVKGHS